MYIYDSSGFSRVPAGIVVAALVVVLGVGFILGSLLQWVAMVRCQRRAQRAATARAVQSRVTAAHLTKEAADRPPVRLTATSHTLIHRAAEEVWAFVKAADSNLLTSPDLRVAATVPGTGPGVGEAQVFLRGSGAQTRMSGLVVTDYEAGIRATYVHLGKTPSGGAVFLTGSNPTELRQESWIEVPAAMPEAARDKFALQMRESLEESLEQTRRLLESGAQVTRPS